MARTRGGVARLSIAVGAALLCAGAASAQRPATSLPNVATQPPPYGGVYQPQGVDEIGLWREFDEQERVLATTPVVIRDAELNAYVQKILCQTVGEERCRAVRIYILREPSFNASMAPNGTLRLFSGMLLRTRNEAELAAILGHEFGHYEQRHGLKWFKAVRSGSDAAAWAAVLLAGAQTYSGGGYYANGDVQVSIYGSLYRYSRESEVEADHYGVGYLNHSHYRPQAAADVWFNLMGEIDASAAAKGLKRPNHSRILFTASHPPHADRALSLSGMADPDGMTRDDGQAAYQTALAAWIPLFLDDQIKLNDFGGSDYLIQSLAKQGWTPALHHARGELYRLRGHPRDLVHAAEFYAHAVAADPTHAAAHRGLGLSLLKLGKVEAGQASLETYLNLDPQAFDKTMILMMLPKRGAPN